LSMNRILCWPTWRVPLSFSITMMSSWKILIILGRKWTPATKVGRRTKKFSSVLCAVEHLDESVILTDTWQFIGGRRITVVLFAIKSFVKRSMSRNTWLVTVSSCMKFGLKWMTVSFRHKIFTALWFFCSSNDVILKQ